MINKIINGDCLEVMKDIKDNSVDMVLCDLPYGTTDCEWDEIINIETLFKEYKRIVRKNGAIVLTSSNPFTSMLVYKNLEIFSHQWIWSKNTNGNNLLANKSPLKNFEDIIVFYNKKESDFNSELKIFLNDVFKKSNYNKILESFIKDGRYKNQSSIKTHIKFKFGQHKTRCDVMDKKLFDLLKENGIFEISYDQYKTISNNNIISKNQEVRVYNPQNLKEVDIDKVVKEKPEHIGVRKNQEGKHYKQKFSNYPKSIIHFDKDKKNIHPTQKPVSLFEYLIKTYSNENDLILDNCSGSGTTALAAINTNRNFMCIEKDEVYYKKSLERLNQHQLCLLL